MTTAFDLAGPEGDGQIFPREATVVTSAGDEWVEVEASVFTPWSKLYFAAGGDLVEGFPATTRGIQFYGPFPRLWYHPKRSLIAFPSEEGNVLRLEDPDDRLSLFQRASVQQLQLTRLLRPKVVLSEIQWGESLLDFLSSLLEANFEGDRYEIPYFLPYFVHDLAATDADHDCDDIVRGASASLVRMFYGEGIDDEVVLFTPQPGSHYLMFISNWENQGHVVFARTEVPLSDDAIASAVDDAAWGRTGDSDPTYPPLSIEYHEPVARHHIRRHVERYLIPENRAVVDHDTIWSMLGEGFSDASEEERQKAIDAYVDRYAEVITP